MGKSKPVIQRLCDLKPGQLADCFVLLAERSKGATREGKPYYSCRFRDARRSAAAMIWADGGWFEACEGDWQPGQAYKVRAKYSEHDRYGPQIDIQQIRPVSDADRADGFDPAEFVEASRRNPDKMLEELLLLAEQNIADEPLRLLVRTLLDQHAERLKALPATLRHFYPFAGGWLEHVLSVTQSCLMLVEKYAAYYTELRPALNKDLVVAAAILHDLGRVRELTNDPLTPQRSVEGHLVGHLILGRDLVRDAARGIEGLNPELVQLLEHIILTHLTLPEWGSPRLPVIPEVLVLHHADDLDAKMEMYVRCLGKDQAAGPMTDRDPVLGKQLYKGRSV
jgi:3'-5' exoribonuclease